MSELSGSVIVTSPIFEPDDAPYRLVIRVMDMMYAGHFQVMQPIDEPHPRESFHGGNDFPKDNDPRAALRKAWCCFDRRVRRQPGFGRAD